jgi:hypothetical protein
VEKLADTLASNKSAASIKKAKVQGIPRQAVLKPAHAVYRLQNQRFALGDRVIMVQDSGSVPLAAKGVVVGLNVDSIDIVWDVSFISGTTLSGRYGWGRCGLQYCMLTKSKVFRISWIHAADEFVSELDKPAVCNID